MTGGLDVAVNDWFWRKVDKTNATGCWPWIHRKSPKGYGELWRERGNHLAHRMSWRLMRGPIPPGLCVLHRCDNPPCVNPDHLFLGTRADNAADRDRKGRWAHGERHGRARLTQADISAIRVWRSAGFLLREIASEYEVNETTVSSIVRGKLWRASPSKPAERARVA